MVKLFKVKAVVGLVLAGVVLSGCVTAGVQSRPVDPNEKGLGDYSNYYSFKEAHAIENKDYSKAFSIFRRSGASIQGVINQGADYGYYLCKTFYELRDYNSFSQCYRKFKDSYPVEADLRIEAVHSRYLLDVGSYQKAIDKLVPLSKMSATRLYRNAKLDAKMEAELLLPTLYSIVNEKEKAKVQSLEQEEFYANFLKVFAGNKMADFDRKIITSKFAIARQDYEQAYENAHEDAGVTILGAIGAFTSVEDSKKGNLLYLKAFTAFKTGRNKEAKNAYLKFKDHPYFSSLKSLHSQVYYHLGEIAAKEGGFENAIVNYSKSIEILETERETINTEAARIGFVGDKQAVYADLVKLLIQQGRHAEAFEYVERGKARALVDMLAQRKDFGSTTSTSLLSELEELERQSLILASANNNGSTTRKATIRNIKDQLMGASPELASLVSVNAIKTKDIQGDLSKNEVALEYYGAGDDLYAFVLTRVSIKAVKLDGKGLDEEVASLRQELQNYKSNGYKAATKAMYKRIIKPVAHLLKGKKLTIIPHGPLHYLPFAALNDGNSYMIDKYDMRFLPSASVMTFLNKKTNPTQDLLAFGNPDLNDPSFDLPGAEAETKVINSGWKGAKILLRKHASEANFKKFAPSFRYLHLASHGEFNQNEPLQSRMLLAPGDGEDGNLTVDELYSLRLNADMVTLSACETGLGDVANGDDVIGLTRGFLYAGAKSIVASLWPVSDEATAYLMKRFYKNLKSMKRDTALRKALVATKSQYPHPIFWSAFQMTGAI